MRRSLKLFTKVTSFNPSFVRLASVELTRSLESDGYIVSPSKSLCEFRVMPDCPAKSGSRLTVGKSDCSDFIRCKCSSDIDFLKSIQERLKQFFFDIEKDSEMYKSPWFPELHCASQIVNFFSNDDSTKVNSEAEMRRNVGDPLLEFLRELGGYKVTATASGFRGLQMKS